MSKHTAITYSCDFCDYGGPYSRPEDFRHFGDVDLCMWCCEAGTPLGGILECGTHQLEFTAEGWTCNCGESFRRPLFTRPAVVAALPSVVRATANLHVQERIMPL